VVALVVAAPSASRRLFRPALLAFGVLILCVAPFHLRNLVYYGTPLGLHRAEEGGAQSNTACTPALMASNLLRHATVHVLLPWPVWNETWLAGVRAAHRFLDVELSDRRITLWTITFDPVYHPERESEAGAPAHFILGMPLLALIALMPGSRRARWCAVAVLLAALGLVVVLKWQPWLARLYQGLFFVGIAAVAAAGQPFITKSWARAVLGIALVLLMGAWWPGRETDGRRLWSTPSLFASSRDANYFSLIGGAEDRVTGLTRTVIESGAQCILIPNVHDVAYPLMRSLRRANPGIVFAEVPRRGTPAVRADALVLMENGQVQPLWREYAGRSDWRLVGRDLISGGVYLSSAKVAGLGWMDALPTFAGWRQAFGLGLAYVQPSSGPVLPAVLFAGDSAAIVLPPLPQGGELRGTLLGAPSQHLQISWASDTMEPGTVSPSPLWQATTNYGHPFTLMLPAATGARRLYFHLPAGSRPVFTRLQLQDLPASH